MTELTIKINLATLAKETTRQAVEKYLLMPETRTYSIGTNTLQKKCTRANNQNHPQFMLPERGKVYRPLTFKENCLAQLHEFNTLTNSNGSQRTLEQRMEFLIQPFIDSCCGIAYPGKGRNSSKFKLILQSPELIGLEKNFDQEFISVDYAQLACTRELDRKRSDYGVNLNPREIDSHEGWLTLFEDDRTTLRNYRKMVEEALALRNPGVQRGAFMAFPLLDALTDDQLRAVSIYTVDCRSSINSYDDLNSWGRFILRKPSVKITENTYPHNRK